MICLRQYLTRALPTTQRRRLVNHEGTKGTKEENTKGFSFFICRYHAKRVIAANEKAAFLKTVTRFSKKYPPYCLRLSALRVFVVHNFLVFYDRISRVSHLRCSALILGFMAEIRVRQDFFRKQPRHLFLPDLCVNSVNNKRFPQQVPGQ